MLSPTRGVPQFSAAVDDRASGRLAPHSADVEKGMWNPVLRNKNVVRLTAPTQSNGPCMKTSVA